MRITPPFILLVVLTATGCSNTFSAPVPDDPPEPGFFGDWVGTFQGSQMTLSIREFTNGVAPGEVRWRDVIFDLECSAFVTPEQSDLSCEVIPTAPPPFCGDPLPFIDIGQALPRERLDAAVGGILREGEASACDGAVIVSWEPGEGVVFDFS